jgi:hypothetical protein
VAASLNSVSQALRKLNQKKEAKDHQARASQILAVQNEPAYSGDTVDVLELSAKR